MRDAHAGQAAIVGIGTTSYFRRGTAPTSRMSMACEAVSAALLDTGLEPADVDGFAQYGGAAAGVDPALLARALGVGELTFSAGITGGGNGSAGAIGLAALAIRNGVAHTVVTVVSIKQQRARFGASWTSALEHGDPQLDFVTPSGMVSPGQSVAMIAQRHMHEYGTTREHFSRVVLEQRRNAQRRPQALQRSDMTADDYFAARMISTPMCLFDYALENDGAVAVVTTSVDRAADLRQRPARVLASVQGGRGAWGAGIGDLAMPADEFASSGHRSTATRLFAAAGVSPADVDVALLYDHFSPMVLMQLEDYGFCGAGEGGPFVADGNTTWPTGRLPVNTHGGHLSESYVLGLTHVVEAVEQIRGTAINQVDGAKLALVTGGPSSVPNTALLLAA